MLNCRFAGVLMEIHVKTKLFVACVAFHTLTFWRVYVYSVTCVIALVTDLKPIIYLFLVLW